MIRLRSLYLWTRGWIVFLSLAPFFVLLSYSVKGASLYRLIRPWAKAILRAVEIKTELSGTLHDPSDGPCVYVMPHVSLFDPLVIAEIMPHHVPGVELDTHFAWPLYGRLIKSLNHIPISHSGPHKARNSLRIAEERLRQGRSLVILPEGRRTRSGNRGEFGMWAFRVAARTGTPVQPIAFVGAFERYATERFDITPGLWRVVALPPVYPEGTNRKSAVHLRASVLSAIDGTTEV